MKKDNRGTWVDNAIAVKKNWKTFFFLEIELKKFYAVEKLSAQCF